MDIVQAKETVFGAPRQDKQSWFAQMQTLSIFSSSLADQWCACHPKKSRTFKEGYCASKWLCQEVSTEVHPDGSPAKLHCPGCGQKVHLQCGVPYLDEPIPYHDKITSFMCYNKYHRPIAGEKDDLFFPEVLLVNKGDGHIFNSGNVVIIKNQMLAGIAKIKMTDVQHFCWAGCAGGQIFAGLHGKKEDYYGQFGGGCLGCVPCHGRAGAA
jgi:hypothetical protein